MKALFKIVTLCILAATGLTFCKKSDTTPTPASPTFTNTQLLTNGVWKWTASTCDVAIDVDGLNGASKDVHGQYPVCFTDDTYVFNPDSTTTESFVTKCTSEGNYKGTWIFTNGGKNLQWNGKDFKTKKYVLRNYTIVEITGSKLVVTYEEPATPKNYVLTNIYTH